MGGHFDSGYTNDWVVGSVGVVVVAVFAEDGNWDSLNIALESTD